MTERTCIVDGCDRPSEAWEKGGPCKGHGQRLRKTGSFQADIPFNSHRKPPGTECSVEGCRANGRLTRGMCSTHYQRWRTHGSTTLPPRIPRQFVPDQCSIVDCVKPVEAHGWCQTHYYRWRRHGDPMIVKPPHRPEPRGRRCTADGCDRKHSSRGFCDKHYRRHRRAENPELFRSRSLANREYQRAWHRANYRRNPDAYKAINQRRRARRRSASVNDLTAQQWREIKAAYGHRCAYCNRKTKLTMDHVIPLSRGGNHTASNIVPACMTCNCSKGDRPAPAYQPLLI